MWWTLKIPVVELAFLAVNWYPSFRHYLFCEVFADKIFLQLLASSTPGYTYRNHWGQKLFDVFVNLVSCIAPSTQRMLSKCLIKLNEKEKKLTFLEHFHVPSKWSLYTQKILSKNPAYWEAGMAFFFFPSSMTSQNE